MTALVDLLLICHEVVRSLVLVATEQRRRLQQGIVRDGARGTRLHWLVATQIKLYMFLNLSGTGLRIDEKLALGNRCLYCLNEKNVDIF